MLTMPGTSTAHDLQKATFFSLLEDQSHGQASAKKQSLCQLSKPSIWLLPGHPNRPYGLRNSWMRLLSNKNDLLGFSRITMERLRIRRTTRTIGKQNTFASSIILLRNASLQAISRSLIFPQTKTSPIFLQNPLLKMRYTDAVKGLAYSHSAQAGGVL
jgi:hypothetical protein